MVDTLFRLAVRSTAAVEPSVNERRYEFKEEEGNEEVINEGSKL